MRFLLVTLITLVSSLQAHAFCGFYVGQANANLFNRASKVVYTRIGSQSTITMASDYEGPLDQFAMVVPVPTVLDERDVRTVDPDIIDHLDRYSAPRLVEYHDGDPCANRMRLDAQLSANGLALGFSDQMVTERGLGVTIERQFVVDGYDIIILSAEESGGLLTWLNANGYQTPAKALPVLNDYIRQGMKFFVAKVELSAQEKGDQLNPLQVTFQSDEFVLPIRLGMTNAVPGEDQELIAWFLTPLGRVNVANYTLRNIPTDQNIPSRVRDDFGSFYQATFETAHQRSGGGDIFLEYGWDMGWCDPCAADPLSGQELHELGVPKGMQPYVSRLHMRYNEQSHREDIQLRATTNRQNFQSRYIIQNAFELPAVNETFADFNNRILSEGPQNITSYWGQDQITTNRYPTHEEVRALYEQRNYVTPEGLMRQCARDYLKELAVRRTREEGTLDRLTRYRTRSSADLR